MKPRFRILWRTLQWCKYVGIGPLAISVPAIMDDEDWPSGTPVLFPVICQVPEDGVLDFNYVLDIWLNPSWEYRHRAC